MKMLKAHWSGKGCAASTPRDLQRASSDLRSPNHNLSCTVSERVATSRHLATNGDTARSIISNLAVIRWYGSFTVYFLSITAVTISIIKVQPRFVKPKSVFRTWLPDYSFTLLKKFHSNSVFRLRAPLLLSDFC